MPTLSLITRARFGLACGLLASSLAVTAPVLPGVAPSVAQARVTRGSGGATNGASSLEHAASNATRTTRSIVGQLIAIALCVAAAILVFKRDFGEAAAVFVVGMLALLLIDPAGLNLLKSTARSLFGH